MIDVVVCLISFNNILSNVLFIINLYILHRELVFILCKSQNSEAIKGRAFVGTIGPSDASRKLAPQHVVAIYGPTQ